MTLAPADLAELLRDGWIDVECPNPGCKDHGLLGWPIWRHRMRIRIETLIAALMGKSKSPVPVAGSRYGLRGLLPQATP